MNKEYRLFPDIRLICGDAPITHCGNVLEISFCISGICEYHTHSGYSYLTGENCAIIKHCKDGACTVTGSADCRMISLLINDRGSGPDIQELIGRPDKLPAVREDEVCICTNERMCRVFSDIGKECITGNTSMLKIKVLELLMLASEEKMTEHSKSKEIAQAGRFICSHLSEHYTIAQLSDMFEVDRTTLKAAFRQIYGCPVYTYARNRKMFRAAGMIRTADMKIIDIAEEVGYSNASKFSCAFREVIGVNPKYFQKEQKLISECPGRLIQAIAEH